MRRKIAYCEIYQIAIVRVDNSEVQNGFFATYRRPGAIIPKYVFRRSTRSPQ